MTDKSSDFASDPDESSLNLSVTFVWESTKFRLKVNRMASLNGHYNVNQIPEVGKLQI